MVGQKLSDVKMSTILHIGTFIIGLALIGCGIKKFALFDVLDPLDFILTVYYFIFGALVCISELPFKSLLRCCSFLGFFWGKAIFLLFLATITFDYSDVYQLVISIALFVSAGCYLFLAITCQKYTENPDEETTNSKSTEKQAFKPAGDLTNLKGDEAFPKPPKLPEPNRA